MSEIDLMILPQTRSSRSRLVTKSRQGGRNSEGTPQWTDCPMLARFSLLVTTRRQLLAKADVLKLLTDQLQNVVDCSSKCSWKP